MATRTLIVVVLASACGFSPRVGSDTARDDAASTTDAFQAGTCAGQATPGKRICVDATHSGSCDLDPGTGLYDAPTIDRDCPPSSTCASGYCQPPANAAACVKPGDCGSAVCDLFVVNNNLRGFCAPKFPGGTGAYSSCAPTGNDPGCATGFCAVDSGGQRQCLFAACQQSDDCPNEQACNTFGAPSAIEGASVAGIRACFSGRSD